MSKFFWSDSQELPCDRPLSGSLPQSGALDFAKKNSFPLFSFFGEEAFLNGGYILLKTAIFVFKFLFLALLQAKNEMSLSQSRRECFKD